MIYTFETGSFKKSNEIPDYMDKRKEGRNQSYKEWRKNQK